MTIALLAYALFCATMYFLKLTIPLQIGILGFQVVTAVINPYFCLSGSLVSSLFSGAIFPGVIQILIAVVTAASFFVNNIDMFRHFRHFPLYLIIVVEVIVLTLLAINPNYMQVMQVLLIFTTSFLILNTPDDKNIPTVIMGYIAAGISISLYLIASMASGANVTSFRRLSFEGNIKSIATIVAIGLMFLIISLISGKRLFSNAGGLTITIILLVLFISVLVLTVAKGVLYSVVAGTVVYLIFSKKTLGKMLRVLPILIISIVFIYIMMQSKVFNIQRIFEEDASFSGRTTIWDAYFDYIESNGFIRYFIGVGTGTLIKIGGITYYSHSTFLDFFISFGLIGFCTMLYTQFRVIMRIIRFRSAACFALLFMSIMMFSTHGAVNNPTFFTFEVILIFIAEREYNIRTAQEEEEEEAIVLKPALS
jgi:O-antigen ligase